MKPILKLAVLAVAICGAGLTVFWPGIPPTQVANAQQSAPVLDNDSIVGAQRLSDAFRAAAKVLRPSVVTITAVSEQTQRVRLRRTGPGFRGGIPDELRGMLPEEFRDSFSFPEDAFRDGYNEDDYSAEPENAPKRRVQTGMGSGVIVSQDGYILTNNHVVEDADELQVALNDGRSFQARVVGTDSKSDVAVLKIEADRLVAARLGDSSRMDVGDWVIAVGSPFGLDQTVTAGIISATNRSFGILNNPRREGYEDFLQTDAAINPGNSGGPLVNLRGEVVGINTAINSRTGTNAGVGFAIPVNMAARIMEDLREHGRVVRGYVGIQIRDLDYDSARELRLPEGVQRGAYVAGVKDGDPADRASIRKDDVITAVNGVAIRSSEHFRNVVALTRPGSQLDLEGYRGQTPLQFQVVVGELTEAKLDEFRYAGMVEVPELKMRVMQLSPRISAALNIPEDTTGVVVTMLDQRGQGFRLGLRPEDVILEVNGKVVDTPETFASAVADANQLRMIVTRNGQLIMLRAATR